MMKKAPTISVVVPIYNAEKYISKCVNSIIEQTYADFEILLINDGSTDKSLDLVESLSKQDDRIKVINQSNKGVTKARSKGVRIAKGEWICFVDSDDCLPPYSIEILMNNSNDVDIVIGQTNFISFTERFKWPFKSYDRDLTNYQYLKKILIREIHGGPCARLYKKYLFNDYTFEIPDNITYGEDLIMNLRIGCQANKIRQISQVVYNYIDFVHVRNKYLKRRLFILYYKIISVRDFKRKKIRIIFWVLYSYVYDEICYIKNQITKTFIWP